jgi:nitrate/nitrite transporter NarK
VRVAVGIVAFLFAAASIALIFGSGVERRGPDEPDANMTMFWAGLGCFAVFLLIGLAFRAAGAQPDERFERRTGGIVIAAIGIGGFVAGFVLDALL